MKALTLILFTPFMLTGCQQQTAQSGSGVSSTAPGTTANSDDQHLDSINRTYHLQDLQRIHLAINGHKIEAWVMDDEGKRQEGMMWLTANDVGDDDGMVFVFPGVQQPSNGFWMKNTILALDITFISKDKKVINTQIGHPYDQTNLQSNAPYEYVLEMKEGATGRLGIKPGTLIPIPDSIKGRP